MELEDKGVSKQNFWVKCSQVIIKCPGKPDSEYSLAWFLLREDEIVIVNERADSILTRILLEGNQHIHSYWEIWGKRSHTYKKFLIELSADILRFCILWCGYSWTATRMAVSPKYLELSYLFNKVDQASQYQWGILTCCRMSHYLSWYGNWPWSFGDKETAWRRELDMSKSDHIRAHQWAQEDFKS